MVAAEQAGMAERIFCNGRIWCGMGEGIHQALAVADGRVLARGTDAEIRALARPMTEIVDLEGRFATPGLNDAHLHLIGFGTTREWIDSRPEALPTLESLLDALKRRAAVTPKGEWIISRGYDHHKLDVKRHPTAEDLDAVTPDHPVVLIRTCGHVWVVNSRALEIAGVDLNTPTPQGGLIERKDGKLTGLMAETGRAYVRDAMPVETIDSIVNAIEHGGKYLSSLGITSCMEAALGHRAGVVELDAYAKAKAEGRLPVRVWATILGDPGRSLMPEIRARGLKTGDGDEMFRIGGVKYFLDGSAGGRTAWMSKAYEGGDEVYGVGTYTQEELDALVLDVHKDGFPLVCHAIGDAAIGQMITSLEKALSAHPRDDHRHRIEHCGFLSPEQMDKMEALGIYPAPQPILYREFGDAYARVLGPERTAACYPFRTWYDRGFRPSASTDAPVCRPEPLPNIHSLVTRSTVGGSVYGPEQKLTMEEALQAYTEFSAFAEREEARKGKLVAGQLADMTVFSHDLLAVDPDLLLSEVRCEMTILGGAVVYRADPRAASQEV